MQNQQIGILFYQQLKKILALGDASPEQKVRSIYKLFNLLLMEVTKDERIQFSTLFARLAYVGHKYRIPKKLQYFAHLFRRKINSGANKEDHLNWVELSCKVVILLNEGLMKVSPPEDLLFYKNLSWPLVSKEVDIKAFFPKLRVIVLEDIPEHDQLMAKAPILNDDIYIQYNIADRNENFNPSIEAIKNNFGFPVVLNLIDVEVDQENIYRPAAFVIEPDYLIDVTAVAECFQAGHVEHRLQLLKRFLPMPVNKYLLLGHIANFFLDELLHDDSYTFKQLFPKVFQLNPLAFCLFDDMQVREIMQKAQLHYVNLRRVIAQDFPKQKISPNHAYLEPSFYVETYGLQGRLDLFVQDDDQAIIVELKSGKPFRPNVYGLSNNHFTQTLLYDLMVRDTFKGKTEPLNYILYSVLERDNLKFAPRIRAQQYEAIQARNQLISIEHQLALLGLDNKEKLGLAGRQFFGQLTPGNFPKLKGFALADITNFDQVFHQLRPLDQAYFTAFASFIAREHRIAKIGEQGLETNNGMAALWLNAYEDKSDNFNLLAYLTVQENCSAKEEPTVTFKRNAQTTKLANFRAGDIAVLYPFKGLENSPLENQIFKCSILEISGETITIRLRSRQSNDQLFEDILYWNLEHDLLDSSFIGMYRALYEWAAAPVSKRDLILGNVAPKQNPPLETERIKDLTYEQQSIFRQLLAADDYFLLWGPPGTGKTSVMLKNLVDYLMQNTDEQILLLAYTNRAVDEICEAIESIGDYIKEDYFRIGSRFSTSLAYRAQLLNSKTEGVLKRKDLIEIIQSHRIVVSTVSSIVGKQELFQLKRFDRVIIDEASQILEPLLAGLLTRFPRFVLIGDHKQLPAVVTQKKVDTKIKDPDLLGIGLNSLANSLFERLFSKCKQEGWSWAYAQLSHQGRMHQDIMKFPSETFYESTLDILPAEIPAHLKQVRPLSYKVPDEKNINWYLCQHRMLFIPTSTDDMRHGIKTNIYEAKWVAQLVKHYQELYDAHDKEWKEKSIGIITPFRAQIAQIRASLQEEAIDPDLLSIDTVERYQGGARDIIIISLCTNTLSQLASISSVSDEGIDRKLNVALTRAREQIILLGNPDLLKYQAAYASLMESCDVVML